MPMEDCRMSFHQLTRIVEDWDIPSRITEKIQIWTLRYTQTKIDKIPLSFLFYSFIYFILKKYPQFIKDYSQDKLMSISLILKKTYTISCHHYFKKTSNFDFTFVCQAKALQYFLAVHFPRACFPKELESSIYSTIVEAVLGYQVSESTYSMVEKKLKKKHLQNIRESFDIENIEGITYTQKTVRSEKKIQRKGEFNLFGDLNSSKKHLNDFRMEVHEALFVKRSVPSKKDNSRTKINHNITENKNMQKSRSQWQRNAFSVLNLNQISSAMAMQPGFDGIRGSSGVHISKKRDLRKTYNPSEYQSKQNIFYNPSQLLGSVGKPKSWGKIIDKMKMKEVGKNNKLNIGSPPVVTPSSFQLKVNNTPSKRKSKMRIQLKPLQYHSLNPSPRISMEAFPCDSHCLSREGKKVTFGKGIQKKGIQRRLNIEDFQRRMKQKQ